MFNFDINIVFIPLIIILLFINVLERLVLKKRQKNGRDNEGAIVSWSYMWPFFAVIVSFRSFVYDYNLIPSGSMKPTLYTNDYMLVNKFAYGVRLPIVNTKIIDFGSPQRGDVVVFKYPVNPDVFYVKRVMGVAGDVIEYNNGVYSINGRNVITKKIQTNDVKSQVFTESITNDVTNELKSYQVRYVNGGYFRGSEFMLSQNQSILPMNLRNRWKIQVPQGQYFVMGDNRDESADSRYWGFVDDKYFVGKGTAVFMSKKPWFNMPSLKNNKIL